METPAAKPAIQNSSQQSVVAANDQGVSSSREDLDGILNHVGEQIFAALRAVAQSAQMELSGSTAVSTNTLVRPTNSMVSAATSESNLGAINTAVRDDLRRLIREPFVARVEVDWEGSGKQAETYYFSRPSVAGLGRALTDAKLVTSRADHGRLAEHEAGDTAIVKGRKGLILTRSVFTPTSRESVWDALVRIFETMPRGDVLDALGHESLRQVLEEIKRGRVADEDFLGLLEQEAAAAELERNRVRRKVVDRIALRDQPILDKFQGEVFRLPLDRQVLLFGPPGSGKTTTLIKRLAQKRTPSVVTEDEEGLLSDYIRDNLFRREGWAMFSPTELLKKYLGEAFNQEGVPDADNVRTWEKERHDLARHVLGILRSTSSGRFLLESNSGLLVDPSSHGIAQLHDDFSVYAETQLLKRFNDALAGLEESDDEMVGKAMSNLRRSLGDGQRIEIRDVLKLFDETEALQVEVKRIGDSVAENIKKIFNRLLNANRSLLDELVAALPAIKAQEVEEAEEDADEVVEVAPASANERLEASNLLLNALRGWARAVAEGRRSIGGQAGRVIEIVGSRLPPESEFVDVGTDIVTRSQLRTLVQAPRTFVLGLPALYGRFRRQSVRDGRHFAGFEATTTFVARNKITPDWGLRGKMNAIPG